MLTAELKSEESQVEKYSKFGEFFSYTKSEVIFIEREQTKGAYYLLSGSVKFLKTSISGKQNLIGVANKGCIFGWNDLAKGRYLSSAEAVDFAEVIFISEKKITALKATCPEFFFNKSKI